MNCPTCDLALHEMGCHTTASPMYWCLNCGTFRTCEGEVMVPVRQRKVVKTGSGCLTCGQPTDPIRTGNDRYRLNWCSFCGTLSESRIVNSPSAMSAAALESGAAEEEQGPVPSVPKLVERCREFEKSFLPGGPHHTGAATVVCWLHTAGITELINPPSNRSSP